MSTIETCCCGSGNAYEACCEPIVKGQQLATSPLALMRSRYTAHLKRDLAHIERTMAGKAKKLFDKDATVDEWFGECDWQRLEIISAPEVKANAKKGIVEYKAYYQQNNASYILHERSQFEKINNAWMYVGGQIKPTGHVSEARAKIGRNDPCHCGSGKKFKKCCWLMK